MSRLAPTVSRSASSDKRNAHSRRQRRSAYDTTLDNELRLPLCPHLLAIWLLRVAAWEAVHQVRASSEATALYDTLNLRESCLLAQARPGRHSYSMLLRREFPLGTQVQGAQAKYGTSLPLSYTLMLCQQKSLENGTQAVSLVHLVLWCGWWQMADDLPPLCPQRTEHQRLH